MNIFSLKIKKIIKTINTLFFFPILALYSQSVSAQANRVDTETLKTRIIQITQQQVQDHATQLDAKVNIVLEPNFEKKSQKISCTTPFVSINNKTKKIGNIQASINCPNNQSIIYINVHVGLLKTVPIANRLIKAGELITPADWRYEEIDISAWPRGVILHGDSINQSKAKRTLIMGEPIPPASIQTEQIIEAGQRVTVVIQGTGFHLDTTGTSLQNALIGETIRVKLDTGKVISGKISQDGRILIQMK